MAGIDYRLRAMVQADFFGPATIDPAPVPIWLESESVHAILDGTLEQLRFFDLKRLDDSTRQRVLDVIDVLSGYDLPTPQPNERG